jgi:hypothetical protein
LIKSTIAALVFSTIEIAVRGDEDNYSWVKAMATLSKQDDQSPQRLAGLPHVETLG